MATWKKVVVSGSSAELSGLTVTSTIVGDLTGDVTGDVTGNVSGTAGSTTGNAGTATALETARTINGVSFDGTANITVTAAGSTLSDTVPTTKGGTGLTTIGSALQVLRVNDAGTALEYGAASEGDVTGVVSSTTNQLVVTDPTGPEPSLAIQTAVIADAGTALATADQIHSFVTTQGDTMAASTSGNAATATALETARDIGGVSFNGTANINLPGVNAAGTQDTSGTAATATALATARTIGGTSFDGTANIAVALSATSTALATARTIGGVSFDGTANIDLPGVNTAGTQDTSGTAANATNAADSALLNGENKATMFTAPSFTGNVSLGNQISDQVTVNGDLIVKGTASFENTENLLVKDRFITLASGSTNAAGDGGIVVETSATNGGQGPAFAWNGGDSRWGVAALVQSDATSYAADAFMSVVLPAAAANTPTAIAAIDTNYNKNGNIYTSTATDNDIWIYS